MRKGIRILASARRAGAIGFAFWISFGLSSCGGGGGGGSAPAPPVAGPAPGAETPPPGGETPQGISDPVLRARKAAADACPTRPRSSLCDGAGAGQADVPGFTAFRTRADARSLPGPKPHVAIAAAGRGAILLTTTPLREYERIFRAAARDGTSRISGAPGRCELGHTRSSVIGAPSVADVSGCLAGLAAADAEGVALLAFHVDAGVTRAAHLPDRLVVIQSLGDAGGAANAPEAALIDSGRWLRVAAVGADGNPQPGSRSCRGASRCLAAPGGVSFWSDEIRDAAGTLQTPSETLDPDSDIRITYRLEYSGVAASVVAGVASAVWGAWDADLEPDEIVPLLESCAVGPSADLGAGRLSLECLFAPSGGALRLPDGFAAPFLHHSNIICT